MSYDKEKFNYSRIKTNLTGKGIGIALIDQYDTMPRDEYLYFHGDKSAQTILNIVPEATIYKCTGTSQMKDLLERGMIQFISISMAWTGSVSSINKLADQYGVYIIAAAGNNGKEMKVYPSSGDKCLSVAAFGWDASNKKPYRYKYSNSNNKIDIGNFSDIEVKGISKKGVEFYDRAFGGTSAACPYTTGMCAQIADWWRRVRPDQPIPSYKQLNALLLNSCVDMIEEKDDYNYDIRSGFGVPRLPDYLPEHWFAFTYDWLINQFKFNKLGETTKYPMFDMKHDWDAKVTRGIIWEMIASLMGLSLSSTSARQQNKAFDFIKDSFGLYANNADSYILKGDLLIALARYLLMNELDTDGDGIADIIDIENVDWNNTEEKLAFYMKHVEVLKNVKNIDIYDTSRLFTEVTFAEAGTMIARVFDYIEDYYFIDQV